MSANTSTTAVRRYLGEKSPQARAWSEAQVQSLIEHGPVRYLKEAQGLRAGARRRRQTQGSMESAVKLSDAQR